MFNQKVTKEKWQQRINQPQIDYINIYEKTVSRMQAFPQLETDNQEGQEFYGSAALYDSYLDRQIASASKAEAASHKESNYNQTSTSYNPALLENLKLALTAARFVPTQNF